MQKVVVKNIRKYIQWIPFLGIFIGTFAFVYATFVKEGDPLVSLMYGFALFVVHILVWLPATLILRKMDKEEY